LAFDATTQDGVHVNSIHITHDSKCSVLSLDLLPGGTAVDYATHVITTIRRFANLYAKVHGQEVKAVEKQMQDNITCIMTDRAVVNQAAIRLIEEEFGHPLAKVNCNLHPLDSIATKCKTVAQQYEKEKGVSCPALFSGTCLSEKIVLGMNTLRFKDSSGSPAEVKSTLDEHNLPRGLISRYRGNRLHVLFHLCYVYHENLSVFVNLVSSANSALKSALKVGFAMPDTMVELHAFAVFGKLLSALWMAKFYTNDPNLTFVQAFEIVKSVILSIEAVLPMLCAGFKFTCDMFGNPIVHDESPLLWNSVWDSEVYVLLQRMLSGACDVLKRQYAPLFQMDEHKLADLAVLSSSARVHNIDAEEVVGMFSAALTKAPNATMSYLSARIRSKKNGTMNTLIVDRPGEERFKFVIHEARKMKDTRKDVKKLVMLEIRKRIYQKKQKAGEQHRTRIDNQLKKVKPDDRIEILRLFPDYEDEVDTLMCLLAGDAVDAIVTHNYVEGDKFETVCYNGKLERSFKRGKISRLLERWTRVL
jgi:hypothetical protein